MRVNVMRHPLFSGAAVACEQDRSIRLGDPLCERQHVVHGLAAGDQVAVGRIVAVGRDHPEWKYRILQNGNIMSAGRGRNRGLLRRRGAGDLARPMQQRMGMEQISPLPARSTSARKLSSLTVAGAVVSGLLASACHLSPLILAALGLAGDLAPRLFPGYRSRLTSTSL